MVYDPVKEANGLSSTVYKYKDGIKLMESNESYNASSWLLWDITNAYSVGTQRFSIACGNTIVDIPIEVTTEGSRDLGLANAVTLMSNFTAAGRSNSEVKSTRSVWASTVKLAEEADYKQAILTGFNW
jgi:homoserine acetyltransferase